MRAARRLLFFTVLTVFTSAAGSLVALPADAASLQHCQLVKGVLGVSPGLTDQPADHTISLGARVMGCSRSGGSGFLLASTGAVQASCANFTTALQPTNATIAWAGGKSSTVSMTFQSYPGSPNRLVLAGRVITGAGLGDRVDGGLHLIAPFTRVIRSPDHHQEQQQQLPVTGKGGTCTVADPLVTIKFASFQSLKFSTTGASTASAPGTKSSTSGTKSSASGRSSGSTTTTAAPAPTLPRAKAAVPPKRIPAPRAVRPRTSRPAIAKSAVMSSVTDSNAFLDPESALGIACIAAAVLLLVALLWPSGRTRRRRAASRLLR